MLELLAHDTHIWVAISFIIFVFIAFKLGRKSIVDGLDGRINEIKEEIETAERLRVEAQELLAQYQRKRRDAEKEAKDILKKAKVQAKELTKSADKELTELMERREGQLTERLRRLEENAIVEIQGHAADLAVAATTEMIIQTLDEKTNTKLNEDTINSLSKHLN
jgi:F-type H+-transporting ATPase subunit b